MRKVLLLLAAMAALGASAACGGGDDDDVSDQDAAQIGSLSENATYAIIDEGGAGLYDYLAESVTNQCTEEQVAEAFDSSPNVTGWKQITDIELTSNEATATVIVLIDGEEEDQPWEFVRAGDSWRISALPGLEDCTG
jgi:hypothetical protein